MTLIVGIRCLDGIVMASDSAATYAQGVSPTIGQQEVTKVLKLGDSILFSSTGAVGISQVLATSTKRLWDAKSFARKPNDKDDVRPSDAMMTIAKAIHEAVAGLLQSANSLVPLIGAPAAGATVLCKSMVALPIGRVPCLFQFDYSGAPEQATEQLPFIALGSGQSIADPFLAFLKRILWKERAPTVAEGRFVAAWTVQHVAQTNPGGVGLPLQLATLQVEQAGPKIEFFSDPSEHYQAIEAAEHALRDHIRAQGQSDNAAEVPKPGP